MSIITEKNNKNCKLIGIHNGIQYLVRESDGVDFYYSTGSGKTAMSIQGIARMLDSNADLISNKAQQVNAEKTAELFTAQGIRTNRFVVEDDIPDVLEAIIKSKAKKQTKLNASKVLKKLAQAGFRLMVLLEVAPEKVAIEAIKHTTTTEQLQDIQVATEQHQDYIESFHSLGEELKANNCRYAVIHGFNNKLVGVEKGKRKQMSTDQKEEMTVAQIFERRRLSSRNFKNGYYAENAAKKAGTEAVNSLKSLKHC